MARLNWKRIARSYRGLWRDGSGTDAASATIFIIVALFAANVAGKRGNG